MFAASLRNFLPYAVNLNSLILKVLGSKLSDKIKK